MQREGECERLMEEEGRENAKSGGRVRETLGHPVQICPCGARMQDQALPLVS